MLSLMTEAVSLPLQSGVKLEQALSFCLSELFFTSRALIIAIFLVLALLMRQFAYESLETIEDMTLLQT